MTEANPNLSAADETETRIAEAVSKALADRDATHARTMERERYFADKMKDVPKVYRDRLGDDAAKFAELEQTIRRQFRADLEAVGIKAPNVGTLNGGGMKIYDTLDRNKASATQNISEGLVAARSERPEALPVPAAMQQQ